MRFIFLLVLSFILPGVMEAQQATVLEGVVVETNAKGEISPISGAGAYWKGSSKFVVTDSNGVFKIPFEGDRNYLIVRATGYATDTILVSGQNKLKVVMISKSELKETVISYDRKTSEVSFIDPWKTTIMNEKELFKAACCNLSESFETNPSVDVAYSDALTGTKQIQMLGLAGQYTQVSIEQMPGIRGIASNSGLNYIPGAWINSIQMAKGVSSVVNGTESVSGLINVELHEPDVKEKALFNAYVGEGGRYEANAVVTHKPNQVFSHSLLMHANTTTLKMDRNKDGYLDNPLGRQYNLMYRFKADTKKGWIFQGALQSVSDNRYGGQVDFEKDKQVLGDTSLPYGITNEARRWYGYAKAGYIFPRKKYASLGVQYTYTHQKNEQIFGIRPYNANMQSQTANFIFQSIIGNSNHKYRTGLTIQQDRVEEEISQSALANNFVNLQSNLVDFRRNERVNGGFFEYTYTYLARFTFVAGLRADHHNYYGMYVSPRIHLRYAPTDNLVLRGSAGRGWRTANVLAENSNVWVSQRQMGLWPQQSADVRNYDTYGFKPEDAWNYGLNLTWDFKLNYRRGTLSADYYFTFFNNRVLSDRDYSTKHANVYATQSFSNSVQVQLDYSPFRRFDMRLAYRYYQVEAAYWGAWKQEVLIAPHRGFINLSYQTKSKWAFDLTGTLTGPKRLPTPDGNTTPYTWEEYSPVFGLVNAQVTKTIKKSLDIYLGCENIFNFKQLNPIIDAMRPYNNYFDAGMIWGPVFGRMLYGGLRWKL